MAMEQALRARLKADAAVTAACGGRIYWNVRPERTAYPALVLQVVVAPIDQHFDGFAGFQRATVQFTAFAKKQSEAVAIREAVIAVIAAAGDQDGVEFLVAQNIEKRATAGNTSSAVIHQEIIDAEIHHT